MVNFLKYRWLYFLISFTVIGSGLFSAIHWGYNYSIDFVGGSNLHYQVNKDVPLDKVKELITKNNVAVVSIDKTKSELNIRTKAIDESTELKLRKAIEKNFQAKVNVLKTETVGPTIGKETIRKTLIAALLAITGILIYMSFAFKGVSFAIAAVVALIHDILVVVGVYALLSHFVGAEVDTLFVTALLTTMSFSVHDTIIIFDKIREYLKHGSKSDIEPYANKALTETIVRSFNNSMTIFFMLVALVLLGGFTIKYFAITLLVGTITGTYSSPFIATPAVVWLEKRRRK